MAPRLVSRADEIGLLGEATQRLSEGRGGCIGIIGEPGIGKSSLLASWLDGHPTNGLVVRSARAVSLDVCRPLEVLRHLVPELSGTTAEHAGESFLAGVERIARTAPAIFVIDDLHHADPQTVDALVPLCRRAEDLGVLLVVALRPDGHSSALAAVIDAIGRAGRCLWPAPLDEQGLRDLVRLRLGAQTGPRLAAALSATAGNPFLADEYLGCLSDEGSLTTIRGVVDLVDRDRPAVSEDLGTRLIARAMAGLPDGYDVLRTIAVLPGGATPDEVASVLELPIGQVTATCLRAVESGTLRGDGPLLCFRHELLRRAIADRVPAAIAASIARRTGEILVADGGDPTRIAACWLAGYDARRPGHVDRLYELGCRFEAIAPVATASVLAAVADHLQRGDSRGRDVALRLGWSLLDAGRPGEVTPMLDRIGPDAGIDAEVDRLRDVADSLSGGLDRVLVRLARFDPSEIEQHDATSDGAVVDRAAHAALLLVAGRRFADAVALLDWVAASPTPSGPLRRALVATVGAWLASTTGQFRDGVESSREALRFVDDDRVRWLGGAIPTVTEALCLGHLGRLDEACDLVRAGETISRPSWGPPLLHAFGTSLCYRSGRFDDALAEYVASTDASGPDVHVTSFYSPQAFAALIAAARSGRAAGRSQLVEAGLLPGVYDDRVWPLLAHVLTAPLGVREDETTIELIVACVAANASLHSPAHLLCGGAELARFAADRGRADVAISIADQIEQVARRTDSPFVDATRRWLVGTIDESAETILDAAESFAEIGYVVDAARATHHAAVLAVKASATETARTMARLAIERYAGLDADAWAADLRAELRAFGVNVRRSSRPQASRFGWDALTSSEHQVVVLVADGLTNAEIAARLVLSRRTVEAHLRRVYVKVGLSTRPQLLRAAIDRTRAVSDDVPA